MFRFRRFFEKLPAGRVKPTLAKRRVTAETGTSGGFEIKRQADYIPTGGTCLCNHAI
jgi:hypothetical protein